MNEEEQEELRATLRKGNRVLLAILIIIGIAFLLLRYYGKF